MAKQDNAALSRLKASIKSLSFDRLYVFYGEETFLLQYYLEQMRKKLLDPVTETFNYHRLTQETFDLRTFADAVENMPMMAEATMVQVDEVDFFKMNEGDREKAISVLSDIPDYCTVVLTYDTVAWKPDKRLKKLWAVFEDASIVEFQKQEQRDLVPWITRHFAVQKKRISPELCVYLLELTGGTMTSLASEIQKICAYSGAEVIVRQDIDAVTEPVLDAVVFQMTDFMGQGRFDMALGKLQQLLKMQEEPIAILGAVGMHFRRMATARILSDRGRTGSDLMKLCGMSDYAARKTMESARRFSPRFYKEASKLVLETDYKMKTSYDDQDRLLEMLLLSLSREARNG